MGVVADPADPRCRVLRRLVVGLILRLSGITAMATAPSNGVSCTTAIVGIALCFMGSGLELVGLWPRSEERRVGKECLL